MKDTFGEAPKPVQGKNLKQERRETFSCTVLSWGWKWDTRLKSIIGIQSETTIDDKTLKSLPDNKTNNTNTVNPIQEKEPSWFRIAMFLSSGILGMWGTLTIWNNGYEDANGYNFFLGQVEVIPGFLALFACILAIFLFHEAIGGFDIED